MPRENIYIFGKDSLKADAHGLKFITAKTEQVNPDIVVIELGTNDLVVKRIDEEKQVNETLCQLFYLCDQLFKLGVQKVILCEIVDCRKLHGNTTQAEFDRKQQKFNQLLNRFTILNQNITIWRHERSILKNLKEPEITGDKIHITTDNGLKLYNFSIRAAIIKGLKALQQ